MDKKKRQLKSVEMAIYKDKERGVVVEADVRDETIWLNQAQIAVLFDTERSVITKHIRNIFQSGELSEKSNVQKMHIANSDKPVGVYALDVIISVGYRVNSKRATQFRIWATKILKEHLVEGYTVNERRLLEAREKFHELQEAVTFLQAKSQKELLIGQAQELLNLLSTYAKTLTMLERYDKSALAEPKGKKTSFVLTYEDCRRVLATLKQELAAKKEATELFANERDHSFEGVVKNLYQTFGGKELYPTLEHKAAHLLYLTIKDHPFTDGNKRSAAFLFVYFLNRTNALYRKSGEKKINDNALAALALLVAESDPKEKEAMVKIIMNLITD